MAKIGYIQLGKQGITDNFIETLKAHFKSHTSVRISVLKSARGEGNKGKEQTKNYSQEILKHLGSYFSARIIGFTIILKKWRKKQE